MSEIADLSAVEMVRALRDGEVSATELTDSVLNRIEERNEEIYGFVHISREKARAQAEEVDRRLRAGESAPLLGVPVPIKDLTMVAGEPMQAGSAALAGFVPDVDDGVVTLLEQAGAIMVGKTATPELGLPPYTETDIAPAPQNPWDLSRSPGGSSGGAGAAVAAGMVPIAHGSDGGGSIRIPAAACGLVGLKPSRGRVSEGPYSVDGPGLGAQGVLTRTVADTAVALDVLSQPWPGDDRTLPQPEGGYLSLCERAVADPLKTLRIGVLLDPIIAPDAQIHEEAVAGVEHAVDVLRELGHEITSVPVPFQAEEWQPFLDVWSVMAASAPIPEELEEQLVPFSRWMRDRGRGVSGLTYANAISNGQLLQRKAAAAWADVDIVLSPTLAGPAAKIGSLRNDADPAEDFLDQCRYTPWTSTWNILGAPSISLPMHWASVDGVELPFGVMLGARTGREDLLLALAAKIEAVDPWAKKIAPIAR